jgi:sigma-B regulation protein RsbU (phosphoserine phosphatase)
MPPVTLGAIILAAFFGAAVARIFIQRRIVGRASVSSQPKRQFLMDIFLCLAAGIIAFSYNHIVFGFPLGSGISLLFGCIVIGFFLALDMSLDRERWIICDALQNSLSLPPPKRLFPVTRKFSLVAVAATLFVSLVVVMVLARDIIWLSKIEQTESALLAAQMSVTYEIFFITGVLLVMIINLIWSYSKNLKLLFQNETSVLERVSMGDLSRLVPVATNDEFGVIADHTNNMIQGLRHRIELISSLKLAEEVQRNLLPHRSPQIRGLDIAGISLYCQETGGDYYDYLSLPEDRLGIVVADASDHGVGAAMHMTTARAFLVYGSRFADGPAELLADINDHLVRDGASSGRFVALFLLEIDPAQRKLRWVRAGHEPAVLYNPQEDDFQMLDGTGTVLGVEPGVTFTEYSRRNWTPGSVVVIGTDGIHETRNPKNQMFGRKRLQNLIRRHHAESAEAIRDTVIKELHDFQGDAPQEDDITLVVVKLM